MKLMNKRGQGTTEYLLMLAAVIIIVAVAVYYVTVIGSKTISASAKLKTSDNTVWLRGESGSSVIAGWSFEYQKSENNTWYQASGDFGPTIEIQLENLTGQINIGDNIVIRYDNSSNEYIVQQYD
jgi:uncharacterized protein (UPF0333 family)